ncbi:glycosyltransferase family 39 protein [Halobacillus rhizosphaerae]|uniref:glycosyltransferase family 39 protein n=1 Tax=Halobacillus rhizosphaerae TaxID=3064889 RepID=UPI00398BB742
MRERLKSRVDIFLVIIVLLSIFLNGYNIWTDQYANTYYTTAVASMMENFHNFFFASLDTAGSVTVDKPPVTFWIQTLSASIFGLKGWSVILPQALAGVGSVVLMYVLIKPSFGTIAARLSALAMAVTPVAVAVSRTNNIDSMLVFTLLAATWLLFRGIRKSSIWSLIGAFSLIGVAFNMKMLQAYMVLPAFYLIYLLAVKMNWKKKLGVLASATTLMVILSLSWAVIVDLTPEDQRPYIGSSENNSVLELAFGYNGLSRLTGQQGPGKGGDQGTFNRENLAGEANNNGMAVPPAAGESSDQNGGLAGPDFDGNGNGGPPNMEAGGGGMPGRNGGGMFGTGEKGPLRLFKSALSGQASWLLPFALLASLGLLFGIRRGHITAKHKETIFWLSWLIPVGIFFSIAGFFHHYYLIMLAPPIAALFGAGWAQLYEDFRSGSSFKSSLLPAAVLLTSVFEWFVIHPYDDTIGSGWSVGVLVTGILFTFVLIYFKFKETNLKRLFSVLALLVLLIGPSYWSLTPIVYGGNSMLPQAGPSPGGNMGKMQAGGAPNFNRNMNGDVPDTDVSEHPFPQNSEDMPSMSMGGMPGGMEGAGIDEQTLSYLKENNTGETYLFATTSYTTAAPYIIDENESVITMGGFSGSDPVYSVDEIKDLVKSGEVKYFLISDRGMGRGSSEVTTWIKENGTEIPTDKWKTGSSSSDQEMNQFGPGGAGTLYEVSLD